MTHTTEAEFHCAALVEALARHAYQYKPGGFVLTSGAVSDDYLDCKQALSQGYVLWLLGQWLCSKGTLASGLGLIGGLTMGADPIAIAASLAIEEERARGKWLGPGPAWFSVRKEPKTHGAKRRIEGAVVPGSAVCVVDDVCTTGGSTISAIKACREEGLEVVQVIVLVDREECGGMAAIRAELELEPNFGARALCTKSEVRAAWQKLNGFGP